MESVPSVEKGWEPSQEEFKTIVAKAILYRDTQAIARELAIPSFRINIVTYTIALVAELTARRIDLLRVWENQCLSKQLRNFVGQCLTQVGSVLVESVGKRNPTEWFKSEQCWKDLKELAKSWDLSADLKAELRKTGGGGTNASHAIENDVARCVAVDAETWFRVQMWGSESGKLQDWQIGIANTLSGYAANGWKRKPSEKQAKYGVEILEIADEILSPARVAQLTQ
jgi:hypothetical protein